MNETIGDNKFELVIMQHSMWPLWCINTIVGILLIIFFNLLDDINSYKWRKEHSHYVCVPDFILPFPI